jgi:hypothetical protein
MAIHTDRPGGGDDTMVVHRAKSADEARKVRVALEGAGIPVELPDQAIDAWFAAKTEELHVKVALKYWAKAAKAIETVIPRDEPPAAIHETANADERQKAAESVLQKVEEAPAVDRSIDPPSAVDKSAQRAFYLACASIFVPYLPVVGAIALYWGASVWMDMRARPNDFFRRKMYAQIATFVGGFTALANLVLLFVKFRSHHH